MQNVGLFFFPHQQQDDGGSLKLQYSTEDMRTNFISLEKN